MGRTNSSVAVAAVLAISCLMLSSVLIPAASAQDPPQETTATTATTVPPPQDQEGEGSSPDDIRKPPNPVKRYNVKKDLVFPIVGSTYFYSGFGACRDNCTR
ncbi:MAG: hypothetical protein O3B42_00025 [Actinomycetota bacterium]|nr:hypothetical protein [Actinomycetota bacterium]